MATSIDVNITITEEDISLLNDIFKCLHDEARQMQYHSCMQGWEALKTLLKSGHYVEEEASSINTLEPMLVVPFNLCGNCRHPMIHTEHLDMFKTLSNILKLCEEMVSYGVLFQWDSLSEFMSLESYMHWMAPSLRESLRRMLRLPWRLSWCINLLVNYHKNDECKAFISCAVKICLKLITESKLLFCEFHYVDVMYVLCKSKCDEKVVMLSFLIFFFLSKDKAMFIRFLRRSRHIIEYVWKTRSLLIHTLDELKNKDGERFIEKCFVQRQMEWFLALLEYGFLSFHFTKVESSLLLADLKIRNSAWNSFIFLPDHQECKNLHNYYQYRCLQVIDLFIRIRVGAMLRSVAEYALMLLWASIPDPYLTQNIFRNCFLNVNPEILRDLDQSWSWYSNLVSHGISERCIRSLKHLSRCAIRRHLALLLQLPTGVKSLDMPRELKEYLLLQEC